MRVAVASADGRHVQEHFGQATRFMIWEVDGGTARLVETRSSRSRHRCRRPPATMPAGSSVPSTCSATAKR